MKNKLIALFVACLALTCLGAAGPTNVVTTPPADTIPNAFGKVNRNIEWLWNQLTNGAFGSGTSGSNSFVLRTNGWGLNLTSTNGFTVAGFIRQGAWIEIPTNGIPLPVDVSTNTICTNTAGPYFETSDPEIFTNDCGIAITYNVIDPPYSNYTNNNTETSQVLTNSGLGNLWKITVTASGTFSSGTYVFTNGAFYKDQTNRTAWIGLQTQSGPVWWIYNGSSFVSLGGVDNSGLLGSYDLGGYGSVTIVTNSYSTTYGFNPRNFVPQYSWLLWGATRPELNGQFFIYGTDTAVGGATTPNEWDFTNSYGAVLQMRAWPETGQAICKPWKVSWSDGTNLHSSADVFSGDWADFTLNNAGLSGGDVPSFFPLRNPVGVTNLLVYHPALPDGTFIDVDDTGGGLRLTFTKDGVCKYLWKAPMYSTSVQEMNLFTYPHITSSLSVDENGTATLIIMDEVIYTIPQSNTAEWLVCP